MALPAAATTVEKSSREATNASHVAVPTASAPQAARWGTTRATTLTCCISNGSLVVVLLVLLLLVLLELALVSMRFPHCHGQSPLLLLLLLVAVEVEVTAVDLVTAGSASLPSVHTRSTLSEWYMVVVR